MIQGMNAALRYVEEHLDRELDLKVVARVEETWQRIYSEWLPSSNYELVEGAELLASRDHKSEIWISVQEKQ
ncbi:GyrI-like domain-containing protein [Paenibacillus daejeonensis]|uniref:GyrI-like domain-containing protein n=1 Tax=Paenibacillus daejeonensis TaxID=135193 RepID=UPI0003680303|nr:hypothetical protein [Paenibacillus daejeonensis]